MTTIATLPAAPNKETDSAAAFSSKANAWVAALPVFITQANAVAGEVNAAAGAAADSEAAAADSEAAAAISAASAVNAPGTSATSTTTMTPALGSKSFTLAQADKNFVVGMHVIVAETAAPSTNWMHGIITSFTPASGETTIAADLVSAAVASASDWTVALSGPAVEVEVPIGHGQTWQRPTRVAETSYQNTTGKSIQVAIRLNYAGGSSGSANLRIGPDPTPSVVAMSYSLNQSAPEYFSTALIVPAGHYCKLSLSGPMTLADWTELR